MSERFPTKPEAHFPEAEAPKSRQEELGSPEQPSGEHEHQRNIEQVRRTAEEQSLKAEEIKLEDKSESSRPSPQPYVDKQLKTMAYDRLLNRARKQLNPLEKPLSKLMHQPIVDKLSETTAQTVGRPSGILGGGLLALIGTAAYYYICRHYGYSYNYFVFIFLLSLGFFAGWLSEVLLKILRKKRKA